ncbi:hypothetical protein GCM10009433_19230 [Psychroflexus lacisalsi]|uniref:Uncharacterized protein n=1 Tax=Psychroflexus lacisalsi TaxID=503928 RepID=A0ABN1KAM9_9FLAO
MALPWNSFETGLNENKVIKIVAIRRVDVNLKTEIIINCFKLFNKNKLILNKSV